MLPRVRMLPDFKGKVLQLLYVFLMSLLFIPMLTQAAVYNLSNGNQPPCSFGWSSSGNNYQCDGQITLNVGDSIVANTEVNLTANAGFNMSRGAIGSAANRVNIASTYGNITSSGPANVYGSITAQSGSISLLDLVVEGDIHSNSNVTLVDVQVTGNLSSNYGTIELQDSTLTGSISSSASVNIYDSTVTGTLETSGNVVAERSVLGGVVTSSNNSVTMTDTQVDGGITANGNVTLTGGSVAGEVWSTSNRIITNGTDLMGGAKAQSGMSITGGTIAGDFEMTSFNQMELDGVTMVSGSIFGDSNAVISNSQLGSPGSPVNIRSESNAIEVNDSVIYGDLQAPSYDYIYVNGTSEIYGNCGPATIPPDACNASAEVINYQVSYSVSGLTCEASAVTVTAVDGAGNPINPPNGTQVTLSASGSNASWSFTTFIFNGSESSFNGFLRKTTQGLASFVITDGDARATGDINFANTGLLIESASGGPLPNIVAGQNSSDIRVRAVRTDDDTGACVARVSGNRSVNFALECRNPGACVGSSNITVNGSPIGKNNSGASANTGAANVMFDGSGVAPLTLNYSDVGAVRLHASLALAANADEPAITLTGTSSEFVSRPYTLRIVSVTDSAGNANPATTNSGEGFIAAGDIFRLTVEARNALGTETPNFGNETIPEKPSVQAIALAYPAAGSLIPSLAGVSAASFHLQGVNTGQHRSTSAQWRQVGTLTLQPVLADGNYLTAGDLVVAGANENVGRFYPADIEVEQVAELADACTSFNYMGQPFNQHLANTGLQFDLVARDLDGTPVSNYDTVAGYDVAESRLFAYRFDTATSSWLNISDRLSVDSAQVIADDDVPEVVLSGSWQSGRLRFSDPNANLAKPSEAPSAVDAPMDYWLSVGVTDCLDSVAMATANAYADTEGGCAAPADNATSLHDSAAVTPTPLQARLGRMFMGDAHGPEAVGLDVDLLTQYFNGQQWRDNLADNCTSIARTDIAYYALNPATNQCAATGVDISASLSAPVGSSTGVYGVIDATYVSWVMGDAQHRFTAAGVAGQFCEKIDLSGVPWLQYDFNGDGSEDDMVTGRIRYGSYRGDDRILFWREVFD